MICPSNVPKRWYFQKGLRWGMIFLVLSGKMVFFPKNMVFFPWEKSEGRSFSRNTWKYEIFCGHVRVLQTWRCAPLSKKIKTMLPHKNTPEGDRRSRLTFQKKLQQFSVLSWRLLQAFSYIALQRKNPENLIYRTLTRSLTSSSNYSVGDILQ